MKKFLTTSLILFLILFTALVKNSTKKIEDKIFTVQENLRSLDKEYENIKLEFEYLSSSEKLIKFQDLYFKDELIQKNIEEIKIIEKNLDKLNIKKLKLINK